MHRKRTLQASMLEPNPIDHLFAEKMERVPAFLDEHLEFSDWRSQRCAAQQRAPQVQLELAEPSNAAQRPAKY